MKKLIPLTFLCCIILFTSCSKDSTEEENEENAKELIIGKWKFVKAVNEFDEIDYTGCSDTPSFNFFNNSTVVKQSCHYGEHEGEYLITGSLLELEHETQYSGVTDRMRATIDKISTEEMILDVEGDYFGGEGRVKLYLIR